MRAIKCWWPSALTVAVVLWLTLSPNPTGGMMTFSLPYADKIVHAVMMGGITGALIFDYKRRQPGAPRPLTRGFVIGVIVAMICFSALDELLQASMEMGRSGDLWDGVADLTGVCIALVTAPAVCNSVIRMGQSDKSDKSDKSVRVGR